MSDYNPDADPRSANFLLRQYLAGQGMQPNNPNYAQAVRTALSANATNPGLIRDNASTLINQAPPVADAAPGRVGGRGIPSPPIPPDARPELPDSAPGSETRVGGTGGGSPDTSAAPSGGAGSSLWDLFRGLIAGVGGAAATGVGLGAGREAFRGGSVSPGASPDAPAVVNPTAAPPGAPPPALEPGPSFNEQGKPGYGGGARGQPTQAPPITVQSAPPSQPITTPDQFRAANPGASIPVPDPAIVPPGPIPAPLPPQPIQTPDQFRATNPGTANVPPAEVAPNAPRARAPRARVPKVRL